MHYMPVINQIIKVECYISCLHFKWLVFMSDFVTNVQLHILLFTDYTEMKIAVREAHDYAE